MDNDTRTAEWYSADATRARVAARADDMRRRARAHRLAERRAYVAMLLAEQADTTNTDRSN